MSGFIINKDFLNDNTRKVEFCYVLWCNHPIHNTVYYVGYAPKNFNERLYSHIHGYKGSYFTNEHEPYFCELFPCKDGRRDEVELFNIYCEKYGYSRVSMG